MKVTNTAYVNMEVDYKSLSDQLLKQLEAKGNDCSYVYLQKRNFLHQYKGLSYNTHIYFSNRHTKTA